MCDERKQRSLIDRQMYVALADALAGHDHPPELFVSIWRALFAKGLVDRSIPPQTWEIDP